MGQALPLGRPVLLFYAAVFGSVVYAFVRLYEEPALTRRFGAAYERCRQKVPGLVGTPPTSVEPVG